MWWTSFNFAENKPSKICIVDYNLVKDRKRKISKCIIELVLDVISLGESAAIHTYYVDVNNFKNKRSNIRTLMESRFI